MTMARASNRSHSSQAGVTSLTERGFELYEPGGFAQLYRRVGQGGEERFENSWLYVPHPGGETSSAGTTESTPQASTGRAPIVVDDLKLYPIESEKKTIGYLAAQTPSKWDASIAADPEVAGLLTSRRQSFEEPGPTACTEFIGRLFQAGSSPRQFHKRLLEWITDLWPKSYAGIYVDVDGLCTLQMGSGHIDRCYRLSREISREIMDRRVAGSDSELGIGPADYLGEHPIFLNAAPDVMFARPSISCDGVEQFLVVVGPGDVDGHVPQFLSAIAQLVGSVQAHQFTATGDLLEFYSRLGRFNFAPADIDNLLQDLYEAVVSQCTVTRLLVVETSREGMAVAAHSYPSPQLRLANSGHDQAETLPESVIGSLCRGDNYHVKDISDGVLSSEQAKSRYLDNIKSESYFPIRGKRGLIGFLAVGTSQTGEYLARRAQLFQAVADFLALYFSLARRLGNTEVPAQNSAFGLHDTSVSTRLTTLRKLSDGCLHDMNGALSVVFGHAELLRSVAEEASAGTRSTSASLDKIVRAAETVSDRLTALRRVFACARYGSDSPIDSAAFLRDLPLMLSGLARQIRDTKNIDIALAVSLRDSRQDGITASALYDVLLPTVIALMEEAVCSGQIKIALEQDDPSRLVSIEFSKHLLGGLDPGELLGSISTRAVCNPEGELSGSVTIEHVAVTYAPMGLDRIRIGLGRSQSSPNSDDTSAAKNATTERPE